MSECPTRAARPEREHQLRRRRNAARPVSPSPRSARLPGSGTLPLGSSSPSSSTGPQLEARRSLSFPLDPNCWKLTATCPLSSPPPMPAPAVIGESRQRSKVCPAKKLNWKVSVSPGLNLSSSSSRAPKYINVSLLEVLSQSSSYENPQTGDTFVRRWCNKMSSTPAAPAFVMV